MHTERTPDEPDASGRAAEAPPSGFPPDAFFDRQWALSLLDRVRCALAREQEQAGKTREFEALKPWLTGDDGTPSPAEAAARLGLSDGAMKVAVHRLRQRFRRLVKAEIAATVAVADDVPAELDYLIQALSYAHAPDLSA